MSSAPSCHVCGGLVLDPAHFECYEHDEHGRPPRVPLDETEAIRHLRAVLSTGSNP
jgi:hypothetical protein